MVSELVVDAAVVLAIFLSLFYLAKDADPTLSNVQTLAMAVLVGVIVFGLVQLAFRHPIRLPAPSVRRPIPPSPPQL